jgi:ribonuclease Z
MSNLLSSERCSISINFDGLGIVDFIGVSRAASGTAIAVPQLKIQLDAGNNVYNFHPDSVFVTHGHADHSFRLTHFVSRSKPPNFFMPRQMKSLAETYLLASQSLSNGAPLCFENYEVNHVSHGLSPGDEIKNISKNKSLKAMAIQCDHAATPCLGYAFYLEQKKLLPSLAGVDKKVIAEMAKSGNAVTEVIRKPLFMFLGDTTASVFDSSCNLNSAEKYIQEGWRVVFVECSFIDDEDYDNAVRTGHMHWQDLRPVVEMHPDVTFMLMHFSRRYSKSKVDDFFAEEGLPNVRLFIAPDCADDLSIFDVPNINSNVKESVV